MKLRFPAKFLLFATIPSICLLGLFFAGYFFGKTLLLRPLSLAIDTFWPYEHLSGFNSPEALADMAQCYYSPEKAQTGLQRYMWAPFNVPTPFVGTAPMPGGEINGQGFRYPQDLDIPKPPDTLRIFVLGGSTAFGSGAPNTDATIAGNLEAELKALPGFSSFKQLEVVTAANPAWASAHERVLTELRLMEFEPDLVISFSGANDIFWGFRGRDVNWLRTQTDDYYWTIATLSFGLVNRRNLVDPVKVRPEPFPPATVAQRLAANAFGVATTLQARQIPYIFVLQPSVSVSGKTLSASERHNVDRVERLPNAFDYERNCYALIREGFKSAPDGVRFIDLSTVFDEVPPDTSIFLDNVHLGDRGNHLVAQALTPIIRTLLEEVLRGI